MDRAPDPGAYGTQYKNCYRARIHRSQNKMPNQEPMAERIRAVWEVGGSDFKMTVDPNERFYTVEQTLELADQIKELENVEVFEDPIPKKGLRDDVLAQYRYMRGELPFPLALHLGGASDVIKAIRADAVDYLNLGGSMANFVKAAAIAQAAGIPVWHGSGNDLGIMERSYLHAAAVAPNCVLAAISSGVGPALMI